MDIVSLCPLKASGFEWLAPGGGRALTVMCKATFELRPGEAVLAENQGALSDQDLRWTDERSGSVRSPSDRAPYKPRADVVLVGHAYAPGGHPVRSFMTRLVVGDIDKSIEVWCDRGFQVLGGQLLEGPRISSMELRWEKTSGGPDTNNPVGKRFDAPPDRYGMIALGNLQPPGMYLASRRDTFPPVCFAPIAPSWPSRVQKLGSYAQTFAMQGWENTPLPKDFDYTYFNVAPPDQQATELRPNERLVLENLHPEHPRLVTSLPGIRPRAIIDRATGEREEIALVADTLWIDTDQGICSVVWRGRLGLRHMNEAGRVTFWVDGLEATDSLTDTDVLEVTDANALDGTTTTILSTNQPRGHAPPFVQRTPTPPSLVGMSTAAPPAWLGPLAGVQENHADGTETIVAGFAAPSKDPLPFVQSSPLAPSLAEMGSADRHPPPKVPQGDPTGTMIGMLMSTPVKAVLPFPSAAALPAPPPPAPPRFVPVAASAMVEEALALSRDKPPAEKLAESPRPMEVAPPPLIGPLATPQRAAKVERPLAEGAQSAPEPSIPVALPTPVRNKPIPGAFTIERCAAVSATIARGERKKENVFEEHDLSADEWAAIEKHWADAIHNEIQRDKTTLLDRFDAAYMEQLEKERGPIDVTDYAKLTVATEQGTLDKTLEALRLPRGSVMRIERVWMKRMSMDQGLGEKVDEEVEKGRTL